MNLKQEPSESTKDYVTKVEQIENSLRNVNIELPQKALAIHLITKSSLSETSKENVITKVNTDDHDKLFTSVCKVMRELKTLTSDSSTEGNKTFYVKLFNQRRGWSGIRCDNKIFDDRRSSFQRNKSGCRPSKKGH